MSVREETRSVREQMTSIVETEPENIDEVGKERRSSTVFDDMNCLETFETQKNVT